MVDLVSKQSLYCFFNSFLVYSFPTTANPRQAKFTSGYTWLFLYSCLCEVRTYLFCHVSQVFDLLKCLRSAGAIQNLESFVCVRLQLYQIGTIYSKFGQLYIIKVSASSKEQVLILFWIIFLQYSALIMELFYFFYNY